MQKLADVAAETDLGDLDNVVPAQVGRVAESALRQAPDAVVGQVEPLELVEVAQGLGLQLHRHAARPLRVVTREQGVPLFEIVSKTGGCFRFTDIRCRIVTGSEGTMFAPRWAGLDLVVNWNRPVLGPGEKVNSASFFDVTSHFLLLPFLW